MAIGALLRTSVPAAAQFTGSYYALVKAEIPITRISSDIQHFAPLLAINMPAQRSVRQPKLGAGSPPPPQRSVIVAAAYISISGHPDYTYAVTLPSVCMLTNGAEESTADLASSPAATGALNSGGMQTITLSAGFTFPPATPGRYTNAGLLPVTVNYN